MVPGFVQIGVLAITFQLLVIAGLYAYLRYRQPAGNSAAHQRSTRILWGGAAVAAFGQLVALGAVGSLQVISLLSLSHALAVQDAGLLVALVGYTSVFVGFVMYGRSNE